MGDEDKPRHASLDTRRKPLMNTWTPSSLQREKANHQMGMGGQPMVMSGGNMQEAPGPY